jgi:hypothetical protein
MRTRLIIAAAIAIALALALAAAIGCYYASAMG